ncbi:protein, C-ter fragment, truncated protein [Escherichia coli]|uniref:Protein, C-ter, truncated protein n=1 Tax=Escherichia coli TaxID=562 RepID=A0A484VXJ9_ECOLX|nr:protein, C-ter fragment, truncated protein [Escherichia coli]
MDFLSVTDQFFLNLAMAYCKAAMDAGAMIRAGSIVTAMTRNGNMFGIRVSGLGERWFTAPVNHSARSVFHRLLAGAGEPGYGR